MKSVAEIGMAAFELTLEAMREMRAHLSISAPERVIASADFAVMFFAGVVNGLKQQAETMASIGEEAEARLRAAHGDALPEILDVAEHAIAMHRAAPAEEDLS